MALDIDQLLKEVARFEIPLPQSHVLVIDDDEGVRKVLSRLLARAGLSVSAAETGEMGLELMRSDTSFRAVLVDKNLPGINGIEVVRQGKELAPDTEFIVITGYASLDSAIEAMELGAFGYVTKPFDEPDDITKRVFAALEKNLAIHQNRLLLRRLRQAYEELLSSKVEIDMATEVLREKLKQQQGEINAEADRLEQPLKALENTCAGLLAFLSDAAAGGGPLANAARLQRARLVEASELFHELRDRQRHLTHKLEDSEG